MVKFRKLVEKVNSLNGAYLTYVPGSGTFYFNEDVLNEKINQFTQIQKDVKSGLYKEKNERLNEIIDKTIELLSKYYAVLKYYNEHIGVVYPYIEGFVVQLTYIDEFLTNVLLYNKNYKLLVIYNGLEGEYVYGQNKSLYVTSKYYFDDGNGTEEYETEMYLDIIKNFNKKIPSKYVRLNFMIVPLSYKKEDLKKLKISCERLNNDKIVEKGIIRWNDLKEYIDLNSSIITLFVGENSKLKKEMKLTENTNIKTGVADEIKKMKQLFDEGILTEEELKEAKTKLLNKL